VHQSEHALLVPPATLSGTSLRLLLLLATGGGSLVQVQQDIAKATNRLKRHTDSWKKYSDIWKADRVSLLDKFKAKAPPTPAFEEKFAKFQKVCIWNGHSVCVLRIWSHGDQTCRCQHYLHQPS
jgi:hypothetical protein